MNARKWWSGCANECLRSHVSGDGDGEILKDIILMVGAQKIFQESAAPPSVR